MIKKFKETNTIYIELKKSKHVESFISLMEKKEPKTYYTMDNGFLPFIINIEERDGDYISIHKNIMTLSSVKKVFKGDDNGGFNNATMLILTNEDKYIYIGIEMYEFDIVDNKPITHFSSDLDVVDSVAYTHAVSDSYYYFMRQKQAIEKDYIDDNLYKNDICGTYYHLKREKTLDTSKIKDFKSVKKYTDRVQDEDRGKSKKN